MPNKQRSAGASASNWASLSSELIQEVCKSLDSCSLAHMRSVCKQWRAGTSGFVRSLVVRLPTCPCSCDDCSRLHLIGHLCDGPSYPAHSTQLQGAQPGTGPSQQHRQKHRRSSSCESYTTNSSCMRSSSIELAGSGPTVPGRAMLAATFPSNHHQSDRLQGNTSSQHQPGLHTGVSASSSEQAKSQRNTNERAGTCRSTITCLAAMDGSIRAPHHHLPAMCALHTAGITPQSQRAGQEQVSGDDAMLDAAQLAQQVRTAFPAATHMTVYLSQAQPHFSALYQLRTGTSGPTAPAGDVLTMVTPNTVQCSMPAGQGPGGYAAAPHRAEARHNTLQTQQRQQQQQDTSKTQQPASPSAAGLPARVSLNHSRKSVAASASCSRSVQAGAEDGSDPGSDPSIVHALRVLMHAELNSLTLVGDLPNALFAEPDDTTAHAATRQHMTAQEPDVKNAYNLETESNVSGCTPAYQTRTHSTHQMQQLPALFSTVQRSNVHDHNDTMATHLEQHAGLQFQRDGVHARRMMLDADRDSDKAKNGSGSATAGTGTDQPGVLGSGCCVDLAGQAAGRSAQGSLQGSREGAGKSEEGSDRKSVEDSKPGSACNGTSAGNAASETDMGAEVLVGADKGRQTVQGLCGLAENASMGPLANAAEMDSPRTDDCSSKGENGSKGDESSAQVTRPSDHGAEAAFHESLTPPGDQQQAQQQQQQQHWPACTQDVEAEQQHGSVATMGMSDEGPRVAEGTAVVMGCQLQHDVLVTQPVHADTVLASGTTTANMGEAEAQQQPNSTAARLHHTGLWSQQPVHCTEESGGSGHTAVQGASGACRGGSNTPAQADGGAVSGSLDGVGGSNTAVVPSNTGRSQVARSLAQGLLEASGASGGSTADAAACHGLAGSVGVGDIPLCDGAGGATSSAADVKEMQAGSLSMVKAGQQRVLTAPAAVPVCLQQHQADVTAALEPHAQPHMQAARMGTHQTSAELRPHAVVFEPECISWVGLVSELRVLKELRLLGYNQLPTPNLLAPLQQLPFLQLLDIRLSIQPAVQVGTCNPLSAVPPIHALAAAQRAPVTKAPTPSWITDAHLEHISRLTGLTALHLNCVTAVTSQGLSHLKTLTRLLQLTLCDALDSRSVTGPDVEALLNALPKLQQLSLGRATPSCPLPIAAHPVVPAAVPAGGPGMPLVPGMGIPLPPSWGSACWARAKHLRCLGLQFVHSLDDELLHGISKLSRLKVLDLEALDVSYGETMTLMAACTSLSCLRHISLGACLLYDTHLAAIAQLTQLQQLTLEQVDIRTRDVSGWTCLAPLTRLTRFEFQEWNNPVLSVGNLAVLTDESVTMMATHWPKLTRLRYLGKVLLTGHAQGALASLPRLSHLCISGPDGTRCVGTRGSRMGTTAATGAAMFRVQAALAGRAAAAATPAANPPAGTAVVQSNIASLPSTRKAAIPVKRPQPVTLAHGVSAAGTSAATAAADLAQPAGPSAAACQLRHQTGPRAHACTDPQLACQQCAKQVPVLGSRHLSSTGAAGAIAKQGVSTTVARDCNHQQGMQVTVAGKDMGCPGAWVAQAASHQAEHAIRNASFQIVQPGQLSPDSPPVRQGQTHSWRRSMRERGNVELHDAGLGLSDALYEQASPEAGVVEGVDRSNPHQRTLSRAEGVRASPTMAASRGDKRPALTALEPGEAGAGGLQVQLLLPYTKLSSCNGYITHSGTPSLNGSQGSEESVNWEGNTDAGDMDVDSGRADGC